MKLVVGKNNLGGQILNSPILLKNGACAITSPIWSPGGIRDCWYFELSNSSIGNLHFRFSDKYFWTWPQNCSETDPRWRSGFKIEIWGSGRYRFSTHIFRTSSFNGRSSSKIWFKSSIGGSKFFLIFPLFDVRTKTWCQVFIAVSLTPFFIGPTGFCSKFGYLNDFCERRASYISLGIYKFENIRIFSTIEICVFIDNNWKCLKIVQLV